MPREPRSALCSCGVVLWKRFTASWFGSPLGRSSFLAVSERPSGPAARCGLRRGLRPRSLLTRLHVIRSRNPQESARRERATDLQRLRLRRQAPRADAAVDAGTSPAGNVQLPVGRTGCVTAGTSDTGRSHDIQASLCGRKGHRASRCAGLVAKVCSARLRGGFPAVLEKTKTPVRRDFGVRQNTPNRRWSKFIRSPPPRHA